MLCSGSVKLIRTIHGSDRIAAFVKPGEWFGLDSLFDSPQRHFTAVAREDSVVCYIEGEGLSRVVRCESEFLWKLNEVMCAELHHAQESAILFSGERVHERLLNALAHCKSRLISPKRVELAAMLGIPAETISREMRRIKEPKKISKSGTRD
jgi:CRP-like cAMP-binding protein